ncbi:MAG: response regulator transcription factor [Victivallales bacterium]|jgi:phosphoserine phosphatase RsbU/P|nr:response regulator transcription factor [Victivallales bacterium]MBT7165367.1 response regulator transcription factor [Victivallales bacterium]
MRILIAEDNATARALLSGTLRKSGYEVEETVNGTEAWQALQRPDAPELAILDWMMPEMSGLEVVGLVRALPSSRPPYLIILTSRDGKADTIAGLDAGANDYVAKPFDAGELRARVNAGRRIIELQSALDARAEELRQALDQVKTLRGIVPICANCKKIRDDQGYWNQVEVYVRDHTEARFTHGICPECIEVLYPELSEKLCPRPDEGRQA